MESVNFKGTIMCTPSATILSRKNPIEIKNIYDYSEKHDVDVFVYSRNSSKKGTYQAIVKKGGKIWHKVFDFKNPKLSTLRHIQISNLSNEKAAFGK